jgi:hypothetical protein
MTNSGMVMQVSDLRRVIDGMPDDAEVLYERIEDEYFAKHGWTTVDLPDDREPENVDCTRRYIKAFCAWRHEGNLMITAHY